MIMQDHANRDWCLRPTSDAWLAAEQQAFDVGRQQCIDAWKAECPEPRAKISSGAPRVPTRFARTAKD